MKALHEYLADAERAHGHMCAGQVLGVRMSMLGLKLLGIDDPTGKDRKRLVTYVEIDRCATDAISVVTGCKLGRRAMKFRDWGKMAATFVDLATGEAVRIAAKESSRELAARMFSDVEHPGKQQDLAYRELSDEDLFQVQRVKVQLPEREMPGYKGPRVSCAECGEAVNFGKEVLRDGRSLCRGCAGERYYELV